MSKPGTIELKTGKDNDNTATPGGLDAPQAQNVVASIRLKCLELANSLNREPQDVVGRAKQYEKYVLGSSAQPASDTRKRR